MDYDVTAKLNVVFEVEIGVSADSEREAYDLAISQIMADMEDYEKLIGYPENSESFFDPTGYDNFDTRLVKLSINKDIAHEVLVVTNVES